MSRSFIIDDTCTFYVNTHTPSTGAAVDADADPGYRIYEDETGTPILTGTMAKLDDANTTGFYSEQITLSSANGFEYGKSYCIRKTMVVGGVTGVQLEYIQMGARVDTKLWNGLATVALPLIPTTAGRTLDVSAGGEAGLDWANVGSPTTVVGLSGTTVKTATDVETDTQDIQSRLPAALVGGRMDSSVGAMAANTLTASALAADAVTEIQSGLSTLTAAQVNAEVNDVINVDTKSELNAVPAANASLGDKITFIEMKVRNAETQTATDATISKDDGTVIGTAPVSDNGVTFTKGEYA